MKCFRKPGFIEASEMRKIRRAGLPDQYGCIAYCVAMHQRSHREGREYNPVLIDLQNPSFYDQTMNLALEHWKRLSIAEREATARRLALRLPSGFSFLDLEGQNAIFTFESSTFVLIPGGKFSVGFDVARSWSPSPEETASWEQTAREYGFKESIHQRVRAVTLPPRTVELAPLLVETDIREFGWEAISAEDPEVVSLRKKYNFQHGFRFRRGGVTIRIRQNVDGLIKAEQSASWTHAEVLADLQKTGFRFPASDEWEYLCGCGEPTLFRWGDHAPVDRYPTDISPKEAAYRRRWALSAGRLAPPEEGFFRDWDLHVKPNSFGLLIALNPYQYELMSEMGVTRGGDGGCTICGGMGFFAGWLALATAYFEEQFCKHDPAEPVQAGYTFGRRVLDLR